MSLFDLLLTASGGVYLMAMLWLLLGLHRRTPQTTTEWPAVSIVVAARNEAASIGPCLQALKEQEYEGEIQVVVIDDRSEDDTGAKVLERAQGNLKLVRARADLPFKCPKKSALAQGIEVSSGELLLFTDADCQPPSGWVRSTVELFAADVGWVAGYAFPRASQRWRHKLLALDNVAIGALGAGSTGMGRALACTGRNLAYRRQVYEEVGGFTSIGHLIGGDDVYFMRLVQARTNWKMVYNREPDAAVVCEPGPVSWADIIQQKLRHAAKAGHYKGVALALAGAVYGFHLLLAIGLVHMLVQGYLHGLLLGIWGLRCLIDFAVLWSFAQRCERKLLVFLPLLELSYIPYVLLFSVVGRLGFFRWK